MSACAVSGGCGSCIDELFTVDWSEDCDGKACCTGELFMRGDSIKICGTCRAVCEDRLLMCDDCGGKDDCESELFMHVVPENVIIKLTVRMDYLCVVVRENGVVICVG